MAPRVGFEPTTLRLTAGCSTAELTRNKIRKFSSQIPYLCPLQVLDLAAVFSVETYTVALPLSYRGIFLGNLSSQNFHFVSSASAWPCCCLFGVNLYGCSAAELSRNIMWQRPILPAGHPASTFGALKLNFCVRNENRWILQAIVTTMVI